jgi:hypothetical protein
MNEGPYKHGWGFGGEGFKAAWISADHKLAQDRYKGFILKLWDLILVTIKFLTDPNLLTDLKCDDPKLMMNTNLYGSNLSFRISN